MKWATLTSPNRYGECAADDALRLAHVIGTYVKNRGATLMPRLEPVRLARLILRYIQLRHSLSHYSISAIPCRIYPDGWTAHEEDVWTDWIHYTCSLGSWRRCVLDPVFGNDVRLWEAGIEGWREELIQFLPFWIQRSRDIVETFDATPLDLTEEVFAEKVDPYLLEHGSSRQKKDALKHSSDVCLT